MGYIAVGNENSTLLELHHRDLGSGNRQEPRFCGFAARLDFVTPTGFLLVTSSAVAPTRSARSHA